MPADDLTRIEKRIIKMLEVQSKKQQKTPKQLKIRFNIKEIPNRKHLVSKTNDKGKWRKI